MKKNKFAINRDDLIHFLSSATPEEVDALIKEKGKPRKPVEPMIFFNKNNTTDEKA